MSAAPVHPVMSRNEIREFRRLRGLWRSGWRYIATRALSAWLWSSIDGTSRVLWPNPVRKPPEYSERANGAALTQKNQQMFRRREWHRAGRGANLHGPRCPVERRGPRLNGLAPGFGAHRSACIVTAARALVLPTAGRGVPADRPGPTSRAADALTDGC